MKAEILDRATAGITRDEHEYAAATRRNQDE
jgi:hypothetical protein